MLGDPHKGPLLTQSEVDALPDGARVVVTWCGGNGPHEYTLRHHENLGPCALTKWQDEDPAERYRYLYDGKLRPVGSERWHNRVSLAPANGEDRTKT